MRRTLITAVIALLAGAPAAQADIVISVVGDELRASSDNPAEANRLRMVLDDPGEDLEFFDDGPGVVVNTAAGEYCAQNAGPTNADTAGVRCDYTSTQDLDLVIDLKNGTNDAIVRRRFRATGDISYSGGAGCDTYEGGEALRGQTVTLGGHPGGACTQTARTSGYDDHFSASTGRDVIDGRGGPDEYDLTTRTTDYHLSLDSVANDGSPGEGDDVAGIEQVDFGSGNDTFTGTGAAEEVTGGDGRDELRGAGGNDVLFGGPGGGIVDGGDGADRITGGPDADDLRGGPGDEVSIHALAGDDLVDAGAGNDQSVHGGDGDDIVSGGEGDDAVSGENGRDTIRGDAGSDQVDGGPDADLLLSGGDGDDVVKGLGGDDVLTGDAGDDQLLAGEGDDRADGGPGIDSVSGEAGNDPAVHGGDNDDMVSGGAGTDAVFGDFGDDALDPGDDADSAFGGPGDDTISDTKGPDLIDGGEGTIDAIAYGSYAPEGPVSLSLDGVANDGRADEGDNLVAMETLTGTPQADVITGDAGVNYLNGAGGDDRIDGGLGIDILRGQYGNDTIIGRDAQLQRDDMGCNEGGADTAVADANDRVASDCETVDRAPAPAGVDPSALGAGGIGPGAAGAAGSGDRTAPAVKLRRVPRRLTRKQLRAKGVTFRVAVDEPASLEVRLIGRASRATIAAVRDLVLAERRLGRGAGTRRVRLKPAAALLGRKKKLKLRIVVEATDAAGNLRTVSRTLRIVPARGRGSR